MHVYRLDVTPDEDDGDGEDRTEWFATLREARARRKVLIDEDPKMDGKRWRSGYAIDKVRIAYKPGRVGVLSLLNRVRFIMSRPSTAENAQPGDTEPDITRVVPEYRPPEETNAPGEPA